MGSMKDFAHDVSEALAYGGEINDQVTKVANDLLKGKSPVVTEDAGANKIAISMTSLEKGGIEVSGTLL